MQLVRMQADQPVLRAVSDQRQAHVAVGACRATWNATCGGVRHFHVGAFTAARSTPRGVREHASANEGGATYRTRHVRARRPTDLKSASRVGVGPEVPASRRSATRTATLRAAHAACYDMPYVCCAPHRASAADLSAKPIESSCARKRLGGSGRSTSAASARNDRTTERVPLFLTTRALIPHNARPHS